MCIGCTLESIGINPHSLLGNEKAMEIMQAEADGQLDLNVDSQARYFSVQYTLSAYST